MYQGTRLREGFALQVSLLLVTKHNEVGVARGRERGKALFVVLFQKGKINDKIPPPSQSTTLSITLKSPSLLPHFQSKKK